MDDAGPYISIEEQFEFYEGEADPEQQAVLDSVANIEKEAFADYWSESSYEESLRYDYNRLLVAKEIRGNVTEIVGYLLYNEIGDETELLRIAVDKHYRGRHIALELISIYKKKTAGKCSRGFLEVRSSNMVARKVYEQAGYKVLNKRKNYYSNPSEDGIVYEIQLDADIYAPQWS